MKLSNEDKALKIRRWAMPFAIQPDPLIPYPLVFVMMYSH